MNLSDYANIATVAGSIFVVLQLTAGLLVYIRQVRRERVVATLQYYESINQEIKTSKRELQKSIGANISADAIERIKSNNEQVVLLHKVLNSYERLATGLNLGIYDLDTLCKINGKIIVTSYNRYRPYIEHRRRTRNANAWIEFSTLVQRIQSKRGDLASIVDSTTDLIE